MFVRLAGYTDPCIVRDALSSEIKINNTSRLWLKISITWTKFKVQHFNVQILFFIVRLSGVCLFFYVSELFSYPLFFGYGICSTRFSIIDFTRPVQRSLNVCILAIKPFNVRDCPLISYKWSLNLWFFHWKLLKSLAPVPPVAVYCGDIVLSKHKNFPRAFIDQCLLIQILYRYLYLLKFIIKNNRYMFTFLCDVYQ